MRSVKLNRGLRKRRPSYIIFSDATTETDPSLAYSEVSSNLSSDPSTMNPSLVSSISSQPSTSSKIKSAKEIRELKALLSIKESEEPVGKGSFHYTQSLLPTSIFLNHLSLAKEEDGVIAQLRNDISVVNFTSFKDDPFLRDHDFANTKNTPDGMHISGHEPGPFEPVSVHLSQIDITSSINLDEILDTPFKTFEEKIVTCYIAATPVLTQINDNFILNTVVEDIVTRKLATFEACCTLNEAEKFTLAIKYPYLYGVALNSILILHNPTFQQSLRGKHYCVFVKSLQDVAFVGSRVSKLAAHSRCNNAPRVASVNSRSKSGFSTITEEDEDSQSLYTIDLALTPYGHFPDEKKVRDEWRDWGNSFAIKRMHAQALDAYTVAQRFDRENLEIRFTRGASLINLGYFGAALKDVGSIISMEPLNTGLILRKIHCLWGLGEYQEAHRYLMSCLETLKNTSGQSMEEEVIRKNMFVRKVLAKTEKSMRQSNSAALYDNEMFFKNETQIYYNEPEYYVPIRMICRPGSSIANSPLVERVAVTNQPVTAGSILAITKAFSIVFQDPDEVETSHGGSNDELLNLILQKVIIENPTEYEIYRITDENDAAGDITTESVRKFCTKYVYTSDRSKGSNELRMAPNMSSVGTNVTAPIHHPAIKGVWTFPTHIKQACVGGNVLYYICGNLMFIRAICDIAEGKELLMAHIDPTKSYETRKEFMQAKGLQCSCALCLFEKSESELIKMKRTETLREINFRSLSYSDSPEYLNLEKKRMKVRLEDLESLRSAFPKLNFPLVEPLYLFGLFFMSIDNYEEAIASFEKCYFIVDSTCLVFLLVDLSFLLSFCYIAKRKNPSRNRSKKWFDAFKSYVALSYGSIAPTKNKFKVQYEFLRQKTIAT